MVIQISLKNYKALGADIGWWLKSKHKHYVGNKWKRTYKAYKKTLKRCTALPNIIKILITVKWIKRNWHFAILLVLKKKLLIFQVEGVLDINRAEGFDLLRPINYSSSQEDIYISSQIRCSLTFEMGTCEWDSTSATSRWEV